MRASARAQLLGLLLFFGPIRAQTSPPPDDPRARDLLAGTDRGRERDVPCGEMDAEVGNALIGLGQQVRSESYERAITAFRLAGRAAECTGSEPLRGAALNGLGDLLVRIGEPDAALVAAKESVQLHERLKDDAGLAQAWNNIGSVSWTRGDVRGALEIYEHSLKLWTAAGDRNGQMRALNNIGNAHRVLGEFEVALDHMERALAICGEMGDRRSAATITDNIGLVYFWRGEYNTALEYSQRALQLNQDLGRRNGIGKAYDSIGNIYRALGAYTLALRSFEQALQIRIEIGEKAGVMETSHNIGLVHFSEGDYQLAISAYKSGLRMNKELRDQSFNAEAMRNIGAASWRLGQRERAAANFRESLAIARREGFRTHEGELIHDLGEMALAQGKMSEASRLFESSLEVRRAIGDQAGITETLISLGSMRLSGNHLQEALTLARGAIDNATTHGQPEMLWQAQTLAGMSYRRLRRRDEARRTLRDALGSLERLSAQTAGGEALGPGFLENKLSPYHELIGLLLEEGSFEQALDVAERSKARVLMQLLRANPADQNRLLTVTEKQQRTRLRDSLLALNRQIETEQEKPAKDDARIKALESARQSSREDLAAFEAMLSAQHPELAAGRGELKSLTMEDCSRVVGGRTAALIEFVAADRQLFAFLLTSDGNRLAVEGRAIPIGAAELSARTQEFRKRIGTRDYGFADQARDLYQLLLGPFAERLPGKSRLVLVPDGPLWNVPFQALRGPTGFLIESMAVSYAPSIITLREIQRLPRRARPPTLLAMGKSEFGPASLSGLDPLPDAENQVRAIQDVYGPSRSVAYTASEATESRFKTAAPLYTVLHLATHGVLDEASPMYSYLALSPDRGHPEDDGRLEAWEIMQLKLTADLVVLSACDTGRGRIAPGEGVIGMMWAVFAAGARSMVVSQFAVESNSAWHLLVDFHQRLVAGGDSKATCLRAAAIQLLHTPRYAHPYYWAGFILAGDPD